MPEHHIPRGHLHEDLRALDHDGEVVISVTPDPANPERFVVITRYKGEQIETRAQVLS